MTDEQKLQHAVDYHGLRWVTCPICGGDASSLTGAHCSSCDDWGFVGAMNTAPCSAKDCPLRPEDYKEG